MPEWQMLVDLPPLTPIMTALFGSTDYMVRAAGGDFCLPGAVDYQPLHSDVGDRRGERTPFSSYVDPSGAITTRELPTPYITTNFFVVDMTALSGPTRQIPGTQNSRAPFPGLEDEPEWMRLSTVCAAPAGAALIRDVRAWHRGTPNLTDEPRPLPNIEFYAPWFREPILSSISYDHLLGLTDHGRHITRLITADSTEVLREGWQVRATPPSTDG
ncbi:MAG: phytanoyl-CoA dioxygenase family protein [Acidimicrobiales bacterium]|nr:phytanoyl-CoA dioxygenase family protein [Acidimicrobiales bacterium]